MRLSVRHVKERDERRIGVCRQEVDPCGMVRIAGMQPIPNSSSGVVAQTVFHPPSFSCRRLVSESFGSPGKPGPAQYETTGMPGSHAAHRT